MGTTDSQVRFLSIFKTSEAKKTRKDAIALAEILKQSDSEEIKITDFSFNPKKRTQYSKAQAY